MRLLLTFGTSEELGEYAGDRQLLFDNFEHLLEAVPPLGDLLVAGRRRRRDLPPPRLPAPGGGACGRADKVLSSATILERLERSLPLLTGGPWDAPERQQTLRATIAWSHDLLSADEQRLFPRLSASPAAAPYARQLERVGFRHGV